LKYLRSTASGSKDTEMIKIEFAGSNQFLVQPKAIEVYINTKNILKVSALYGYERRPLYMAYPMQSVITFSTPKSKK